MTAPMLVFLALLPIILVFVFVVLWRYPARKIMPIVWFVTAVIGFFVWRMSLNTIILSSFKGMFVALDILFIVFGAILLIIFLERTGVIIVIDRLLTNLSPDRRIQAIFVAWMFGSFIEGAAGFGTPAMLVAPLLVSVGFPALAAVIVALIANSTAVTFGAVGTPVIFGIGSILPTQLQNLLPDIIVTAALLHAIIGTFVPFMMVCILTRFFGKNKSWLEGFMMFPFSLLAGVFFTIPYYLSARFLSPELPSVLGGIVGGFLLFITTKYGLFVPRKMWVFPSEKFTPRKSKLNSAKMQFYIHCLLQKIPLWKALLPYSLLVIFLVVSRLPNFQVNKFLQGITITVPYVKHVFTPFYSVGFLFLLVCIIVLMFYRLSKKDILSTVTTAFVRMKQPFIALIFTIATVQVIIQSETNTAGLASMPAVIGQLLTKFGNGYLLFSPFLGVLGAFITGSNTVSNLLFAPLQLETALVLGLSPVIILALQTVGGAIGNIIAVHNVIAASATVGLHNEEGRIIKINLVPVIFYTLTAALITIIWLI